MTTYRYILIAALLTGTTPSLYSQASSSSITTGIPVGGQGCDIKLTNGFIMRQCRVLAWGGDTVTISYVGGTVPVKVANVAPESIAALEAAKQKAVQDAPAYRTSSPTETPSAANDEQREAIAHGVWHHELTVGMNEAEVIKCMGATPTEKYGSVWRYDQRGKGFKDPVHPGWGINDKWLTFRNGLLVSWTDH